jgi:restriction system protein
MARKKKQSPFEDLIDVAAMLPWWVSLLLALIAYFVLHHYANAVAAPVTSAAQLSNVVTGQLGKTLAMIGQYLVPLAFIIGAGMSAYGKYKRAGLFVEAQQGSSPAVLNGMSWQEFEMLVGEAFRRGGYAVSETGGGGADGGVDLVLRKDGEKFLVQCKQWKAFKVGVTTIRELYGVMAAEAAAGGFVVTSGNFTQEAKAFAEGRNIELIDGAALKGFIKEVQSQYSASSPQSQHVPKSQSSTTAEPSCPKCGSAMTKRVARQGANSGNTFWGCTTYPKCKGVIPI